MIKKIKNLSLTVAALSAAAFFIVQSLPAKSTPAFDIDARIAAVVADDPVALNRYACNLISAQNTENTGCYDWCAARAEHAHISTSWARDVPGVDADASVPVLLSDDYPHEIQNACAIVLNGGEY